MSQVMVSQSVVPNQKHPFEDLCEMQILKPHSRLSESEPLGSSQEAVSLPLPRGFWCLLQFENQGVTYWQPSFSGEADRCVRVPAGI